MMRMMMIVMIIIIILEPAHLVISGYEALSAGVWV